MARRRKTLGDVNPDARAAIQAARAGRCSTALKHLYDTAPHMQRKGDATNADRQSFRIASQIVNKLCVADKPSKKRGRRYRSGGFDGGGLTLHQALARRGYTSTPSRMPGKRTIYRDGKFVMNANATEGWRLVKRSRVRRR